MSWDFWICFIYNNVSLLKSQSSLNKFSRRNLQISQYLARLHSKCYLSFFKMLSENRLFGVGSIVYKNSLKQSSFRLYDLGIIQKLLSIFIFEIFRSTSLKILVLAPLSLCFLPRISKILFAKT